MKTHVLGFPRIGENRELKRALENFWQEKTNKDEFIESVSLIRLHRWQLQADAGLDYVTVGDFSLYDHILDTTFMLGVIPERFAGDQQDLTTYFNCARGDSDKNIPAMDMKKWFDTNYHYIVPELTAETTFSVNTDLLKNEITEAVLCGHTAKAVLVGPVTYLKLSKMVDDSNYLDLLKPITKAYKEILTDLAGRVEFIQIDEPALSLDLSEEELEAFKYVYSELSTVVECPKLLLATYFGIVPENIKAVLDLPVAGFHLDAVRGKDNLADVVVDYPTDKILSLGLVDGRNIWKTDLAAAIETVKEVCGNIAQENLFVASSCSLLHVPVDLASEELIPSEIKEWLSFAVQKCTEVKLLADVLSGKNCSEQLAAHQQAVNNRKNSSLCYNKSVRTRQQNISQEIYERKSSFNDRIEVQREKFNFPLLPTTTIGSFPQTAEIRKTRRALKNSTISIEDYQGVMKREIQSVVDIQEELGLDVLVHGEPERNDMVEYFGELLDGFCFSSYGWVQSYGSRCVKPPIIFGDIFRSQPMTVEWSKYAQSLTDKQMKGMLTGPVTILCWSFVRDDLPRATVCEQIALAIRDEVLDLEKAKIEVIQIDEAALREGLPLIKKEQDEYLQWAVDCFKLSANGVGDTTQIHTHMCYSEFNEIIDSIIRMDADVISIEASRSDMELLEAFKKTNYPNEIGPGIYDIHSPRVPTVEEMTDLLDGALKVIPKERLWVNPDCGLKTRGWIETKESLKNMIIAAHKVREQLSNK